MSQPAIGKISKRRKEVKEAVSNIKALELDQIASLPVKEVNSTKVTPLMRQSKCSQQQQPKPPTPQSGTQVIFGNLFDHLEAEGKRMHIKQINKSRIQVVQRANTDMLTVTNLKGHKASSFAARSKFGNPSSKQPTQLNEAASSDSGETYSQALMRPANSFHH